MFTSPADLGIETKRKRRTGAGGWGNLIILLFQIYLIVARYTGVFIGH